MSDSSTSIVPNITHFLDREVKAKQIIEWLVSIKAVKPVKTDCILSSELGYPIDKGASNLVDEPEYLPFSLRCNGLEVVTDREVFHTGQNGLDSFICPKCNENIISNEWDLNDYYETGNSLLLCPLCNNASDLNDYLIEPTWGFSNLGFTFWNWPPLKDEVVQEFEKILSCKVKIINSHI
ncbi:hypothetical protein JN11_00306 [Mucilaginibacter frigoritolerans]|jgi:hypothetical protein|uniref:Uncharacterized protein n=1 Tax=Mucilaginibacter frigoritolerans TaxID=652788 RepID=A0A562UFL8_9SPHI|nr:hypothetical protein [Mucilaginibacter frigoritolerans]TWJ04594.1 hypothetical protein JN11_00306 [Mucilaginibacter frigoritolerans]